MVVPLGVRFRSPQPQSENGDCNNSKRISTMSVLFIIVYVAVAVRSEVAMVFSVQRHGARNVLPKNAFLSDSDAFGGPSLLPAGQSQCDKAGIDFQARYINASTCGVAFPTSCLLRWFPGGR